jgi:ferredoxin
MMIDLKFGVESIRRPILAETVLETGALLNIIKAWVEARRGEIILDVDDAIAQDVMRRLREHGVEVTEIERVVEKDEEVCIHCGACLSICPVEVFTLDGERRVVAEPKRCTRCGICVGACPVSALSLPE